MNFFSRRETIIVSLFFLITFLVTYSNIRISERRARDSQRQSDLGSISDALNSYYEDFGFFPPSVDGKILGCQGSNFGNYLKGLNNLKKFDRNEYFKNLKGCVWGSDSLNDLFDPSVKPYLAKLPIDPMSRLKFTYVYISDTRFYQLYTYLEGEGEETGFSEKIARRGIMCGPRVCSFGKSYNDTPLDKSIEDYEKELEEKARSGK